MGTTRTKLSAVSEYVAIDTETTGLDTKLCDIIEVAAIRYVGGSEVDRFSSLVKPRSLPIDGFIEELTGITSDELEHAPIPAEVMPMLLEFIGTSPMVGHNVCFDADFIGNALRSLGLPALQGELIDTMRISRHVLHDVNNRKLGTIATLCSEISGKPLTDNGMMHRADYDAEVTASCYEVMKPMLVERYGDDPEAGYKRSHSGVKKTIDYDGITPTVEEIDESNPFYDQTVCFTGALSSMTRSEASQRAVNLGAQPVKGVTKKLNYLVVGSMEFASSVKGGKSNKLKKAEQYMLEGLPIQIASEDFFMEYAKDAI